MYVEIVIVILQMRKQAQRALGTSPVSTGRRGQEPGLYAMSLKAMLLPSQGDPFLNLAPKLQDTFIWDHRERKKQRRQQQECKVASPSALSQVGGRQGPGRATAPCRGPSLPSFPLQIGHPCCMCLLSVGVSFPTCVTTLTAYHSELL